MKNGVPAVCVEISPPVLDSTKKWFSGPGDIVNRLLDAAASPDDEAVSLFDPTRLILRLLKVASPVALVSRARVPLSTPVPVVNATVTDTPKDWTLLPNESLN